MSKTWSLPSEDRQRTVQRTGGSLFSLAFSAEKDIDQMTATESAGRLEAEAYTTAQAQSTTTTGARPVMETLKAYLRKLAELVIDFVKSYSTADEKQLPVEILREGVFDLRGSREFLSEDSARSLFGSIPSAGVDYHTVILSTKSFGISAAQVASAALLKLSRNLRSADLSDIIGGRPEQEALDVLSELSKGLEAAKLEELNLSNNALGEKGLRACDRLFKSQKQLKKLTLHNVGCSANACSALVDLTDGMDLKGLFLYNNMSGDEGGRLIGQILARMPSLESFQMASSRVQQPGFDHLMEGLCAAKELLELDLNDNPGTVESIPGIIKLVKTQPRLRVLNLSDTCLEEDGVVTLANTIAQHAHQLEELGLALNEISLTGAKDLSRALIKLQKLKKLDLHENELGDHGVFIIAKALSNHKELEELNLSGNQIHATGAKATINCIKHNKNLRKLELDENIISEEGILQIKELLVEVLGSDEVLGSLESNDPEDEELTDQLKELDLESFNLEDLIEKISSLSLED